MPPVSNTQFDASKDVAALRELVKNATIPEGLREKIEKMLVRLERMVQLGSFTKEFELTEQYIRTATQLPWGKYSKDNYDLANAQTELNKYHYGLQHVKDIVMEFLSVMKLQNEGMPASVTAAANAAAAAAQAAPVPTATTTGNASAPMLPPAENAPAVQSVPLSEPTPNPQSPAAIGGQEMSRLQGSASHAPVLCFVGIQGVGKTSIAKSIGNALGRKFIRIALGALGTVTQIRGIDRSEPGAEPGQILKALVRSGTMNPVILLDEIDKTSSESGLRADLMAALLEILDPEQNSTFTDHYLDYPIDLSQCIFITTANNLGGISAALLDRLEVVRFGSYTDDDKINIAKAYMLPKVREATGIGENQLTFDDAVWPLVVRPLGFDAGVRQLERTVTILARKVARMIVEGKVTQVHLTPDNFRQFIPEDIGVYS